MEQSINKKMQSVTVLQTASRLGILNDELWNLFYETGAEFLDRLSMRVRRKRTFDAQFKSMLIFPAFGDKDFTKVMAQIRHSPSFWFWWGVQLWSTCHQIHFRTKEDLEESLQHIDNLIPHFILKQVFMASKNLGAKKELQSYLKGKLLSLEVREIELRRKLEAGFNQDTFRSLALVENSIECTKNRINGKFKDERSELELKVER